MIYLLLNLVLMLNLLIALLSNTYSIFQGMSLALYLRDVVQRFPQFKSHPNRAAANPRSYPFTGVSMILAPFLLFRRPAPKLNSVLLIYEYIFHFLIYFGIFAACLTIIAPFSFIKSLRLRCNSPSKHQSKC